ncbi:MAG: GNAT family N-acetyltransferase [Comamonadaceae bacterium]|nr:GNAT family N-acetyltransferase [Comamonadaceae bacterium]
MSALHIALLTPDDMPAVMHIQARCYQAIEPESLLSMNAKRLASPATCLGAWRQRELLGYLLAVPVRWPLLPTLNSPSCTVPPDADTLYLHDLALLPGARGSGAGGRLVRQALAAGEALGLHGAALIAIQQSAAYWQGQGFVPAPPPDAAMRGKLASYGAGAQLMRRPPGSAHATHIAAMAATAHDGAFCYEK